jgi:hypothetical protein
MNLNLTRTPCKRSPRITTLIPPHEPQNAKLSVLASSASGISTTVGQALFLAIHSKNKASLYLSSRRFPGAAETDRITIGAPGQMDVDEVDHRTPLSFQRGITGPKRKSSTTHGDSQLMQEMNAMVVVEQQDSQLKMLHNKRPRLQSADFTMTDIFHSKEYGHYRYRRRRMTGLNEKNKRLVEIVQENEQGMMKERTEAAESEIPWKMQT